MKPNTNAVDMSCSKASAHAAVISITLVVSNVCFFFLDRLKVVVLF